MKSREKLNQYMRVKAPNKEALAELVIKAKGPNRSMRQFADDLGVNASTLSRIVNKKTARSNADTLIADIADHADEESGVTFEMLMEAHGMMRRENMAGGIKTFRESAIGTILKELTQRNYIVSSISGPTNPPALDSILGHCYTDLEIHTSALGKEDSVWMFNFFPTRGGENPTRVNVERIRQWMLMFAGMLSFNEGKVDRFSGVVADEETYHELLKYFEGYTSSQGMSMILIDMENNRIVDEFVFKEEPKSEPVFFPIDDEEIDEDERESFREKTELPEWLISQAFDAKIGE